MRAKQPPLPFPLPGLLAGLPQYMTQTLQTLVPPACSCPEPDAFMQEYGAAFAAELYNADWFRQALDPIVPWNDFNRELAHECGAA